MSESSYPADQSNSLISPEAVPSPPRDGLAPYPSDKYHEHTGTVGYKLSELVFGSLLIAYATGFLWVAFSHPCLVITSGQPVTFDGNALMTLFYAVLLSVCFGVLTASLYVSYHFCILTMPIEATGKLGRDFLLAVSQIGFYGLSLIWPNLCLVFLAACIYLIMNRQQTFSLELGRLGDPSEEGHHKGATNMTKNFQTMRTFRSTMKKVRDPGNAEFEEAWAAWKPFPPGMHFWGPLAIILVWWALVTHDNLDLAKPESLFTATLVYNKGWLCWANLISILVLTGLAFWKLDARSNLKIPDKSPPGYIPSFPFDILWKTIHEEKSKSSTRDGKRKN